ncbi:MAG TPA: ABC transporter permease [Candidatus Angelobacter sp.]|nr:ABC transporter permease [Candidatus Angelobacter sp.]
MTSLLQDVRYGWRTLGKSPGFTAVAVLTLALGIGANSTIFSWINATLLHPLPGVSDTQGLVTFSRGGSFNDLAFSYPDLQDLRLANKSFSGIAAFGTIPVTLTGVGRPERVWATEVSANYFDVLGLRPYRGSTFLPTDDERHTAPAVVISYGFWQTHFAAEDSAIGQKVSINHHPFTVVGIAPPRFQGTQTGLRSEMWIPLAWGVHGMLLPDLFKMRQSEWLLLMGRLRRGIETPAAQQEMTELLEQIARNFPDSHRQSNVVTLDPLWRSPLGANGAAGLFVLLPMLLAIAGVVLLLACVNVANLLLVRSVARRRELAVRLSLGAGRWRLVRQLLVESLLLAGAGGAVALLITSWSAGTFTRFVPPSDLPIVLTMPLDRSVLLATAAISVVTCLVFGILPALRSARLTPVAVLKEEGTSVSGTLNKARLSSGLVVAQMSLSLLLLICAGLFLRSFEESQRFDPGFNPENVLLARFDLDAAGYSKTEGIQFQRQLLLKLEALPEAKSACMATWLPLGFTWSPVLIKPENYAPQPSESMKVGSSTVSPDYLKTMQIPLLDGREFTLEDTEKEQPVAIVNQAFVDRYWPHQEPIGKKVSIDGKWTSVIGVARNSDYSRLNEPPQPFVYLSLFQNYYSSAAVHVRVSGDPMRFAAMLDKTVQELAPDLALFDLSPLKNRVLLASTLTRIAGTLVGAFGTIALILAAIGIYAVIAYTTRQRTREIGIRMAVGAQQRDIRMLVLGQGMRLTIIGLAFGVAISLLLTRFLKVLLFGIASTDALTYLSVALLLSLVSLAACYIPARRAMQVEPVTALRHE